MKFSYALLLLVVFSGRLFAQDSTQVRLENYTLEQCIAYALKNSLSLANTKLDIEMADAQIKQTRAEGLPQIHASVNVADYFQVPRMFVPTLFLDPVNGSPDIFVPVAFQPRFSGNAVISLQQLVFDASYFVALQAARTYGAVPRHAYKISKNELVANVSKSYYAVLINQERLALLDNNLARLEKLLNDTRAMYKNGLVEKLDVDRLEVTFNNFKTEKQKLVRLSQLTENLLKFQMGMQMKDFLSVGEKIKDIELQAAQPDAKMNYAQRPEYLLAQTQIELDKLQIKNFKSGYYPKLYLSMGYGANAGNNSFSNFANVGEYWFRNGNYAFTLSMPIFDGFRRKYQIQKQSLAMMQSQNKLKDLRRSIDLQIEQASISLNNSLETLQAQKKNMELAQEVYKVAQIKYKEGVGSNLEIVDAESSYKEAETNYYNALYDALVAKVDLELAQGILSE